MKRLALTLILICAPFAAMALDPDEMFADPAKEARAREIGRQLRCLVCQNESIFDSNAGLAKELRVIVRERMDTGESDDQIIDYVAEIYGDYVLLKPRVGAQTYVLWGAPLALLLFGGLGIWAYHRGGQRRTATQPMLTDEDRAEAQKLLQGKG